MRAVDKSRLSRPVAVMTKQASTNADGLHSVAEFGDGDRAHGNKQIEIGFLSLDRM